MMKMDFNGTSTNSIPTASKMKIQIGTKICICKTAEMKHQVGTTCGSSLLRNIFKENVLQGHISLSSFGFHFAL